MVQVGFEPTIDSVARFTVWSHRPLEHRTIKERVLKQAFVLHSSLKVFCAATSRKFDLVPGAFSCFLRQKDDRFTDKLDVVYVLSGQV